MFETLFTYRGVQRRHQQGRAADARERFLSHCADQGVARTTMSDLTLLGVWVRRFFLEHLVHERNLARNTQRSYRDTSPSHSICN